MADRDPRRRPGPKLHLVTMSARKSAPFRPGGVNTRRLAMAQATREEKKPPQEEERKCGNPFCKAVLANRYARFCEHKALCQCYRALQLQCAANAQAKEEEEDTRPLALVIKKKKKKEGFSIPRKKEKRRLEGTEGNSSPRQREKVLKKLKKKEEKKGDENGESSSSSAAAAGTSAAEFIAQLDKMKKRSKDPRTRQETTSDAENGTARTKKRRLNRQVSADDVSRSASSSPAPSDANWTIPRAKPERAKTAAQAIRSMNVELVPLGVASQGNFTGGGRYVQNGNRSVGQSLRPSDPRARPPSMTKFASPSVPTSSIARTPSAPSLTTPARPTQTTHPMVPTTPLTQTQPPLPPLPPHAPSTTLPVTRSSEPVRAVTPSSSPVKAPVASQAKPSAPATGVTRTRISTSDYLKNRKEDQERHERRGQQASRPSSLERSSSLTDDRTSGHPAGSSAVTYPPRPPNYRRRDSAPLPTSSEFTARDTRIPIDPRRQYPEAEAHLRHERFNDNAGVRVEYRDKPEGHGELMGGDAYASGQREGRSFPPPRDRYPPRQQESASFGTGTSNNGGYDYGVDTHISPESSPADQRYWRENSREKLPPSQRAPSPRRNEVERVNIAQRKSGYAEPDEDTPAFSYHESFLPRLLSIFIRKFPQSLVAVLNVTKKPRNMNWYVKYVERIERLCQPCDLRVKFEGLKAVVTVRDREWLTLQGNSTLTLHQDVIKSLRAEAMTWLQFYEETKNALAHYRSMYGNNAKDSYTFLRAWNELKTQGNNISLARQTNYFCGARLHHWNFVIGKVEIGSGSHEEKREAFRLATVSALDFLLSIGDGERRPRVDVKRERFSEGDRLSTRGGRRSSSHESSTNRVRASPANDQVDGASLSSTVLPFSPSPSSAGQPSAVEPAPPIDHRSSTSEPQSSAEPSSSPVAVDRTGKPAVAIIPTSDSNSSKEAAEAAEQSDPGEEMSISDASEASALTPAGSPNSTGLSLTTAPVSAGMVPAVATSNATTLVTKESSKGTALPAVAATAGNSATTKDTTAPQTTTKAAIPPRRCMMCEMIRMRKPDGERCLRCQQKGAPANGALATSLGP